MAFAVTPTSGPSPYILTADIAAKVGINGGYYTASVSSSVAVGSCPAQGVSVPLSASAVETLLNVGSVNSGVGTIPAGSCRTFTLYIRRVSDNVVITESSVSVDNV